MNHKHYHSCLNIPGSSLSTYPNTYSEVDKTLFECCSLALNNGQALEQIR